MKPTLTAEPSSAYTPSRLASVISLLSESTDTAGSPLLEEFVGIALRMLETSADSNECLELIAELAEVERKQLVALPYSMLPLLKESIETARRNPATDPRDLIYPLLSLNLREPSPALELEATTIIRTCHRNALRDPSSLRDRQIAHDYIDYL
ncbi:MAG: hypothetical protein K2H15_00150 [Muribaculaceae bacterium]|nr:hypothetical protein [Muribaculaceae bacterium]